MSIFITFEGGEGAGKSTQIKKVYDYLRERHIPPLMTREPGGTPEAEHIRSLLVQGDVNRWDAKTEVLLMNAARRDHIIKVIRPALETGKWVLCDRYIDSTQVYQGYSKGIDITQLNQIHEFTCEDIWPHLTFILDINPEIGLQRAASRLENKKENRFEEMDKSMHQKVREGFLKLAQNNPARCVLIDATLDCETVFSCIKAEIDKRFFSC